MKNGFEGLRLLYFFLLKILLTRIDFKSLLIRIELNCPLFYLLLIHKFYTFFTDTSLALEFNFLFI